MQTIKAIYDGVSFNPMQPIPVKESYEVFITFVEPVRITRKNIMDFAGIWKGKDIIDMEKTMLERESFLSGRTDRIRGSLPRNRKRYCPGK